MRDVLDGFGEDGPLVRLYRRLQAGEVVAFTFAVASFFSPAGVVGSGSLGVGVGVAEKGDLVAEQAELDAQFVAVPLFADVVAGLLEGGWRRGRGREGRLGGGGEIFGAGFSLAFAARGLLLRLLIGLWYLGRGLGARCGGGTAFSIGHGDVAELLFLRAFEADVGGEVIWNGVLRSVGR